MANGRTRHVLQELNRLKPEFTIHLGDLVNPVPALPTYGPAARNFLELAKGLDSRLHLVPGNHDVGDKPIVWGPAGVVSDANIALWKKYFGKHFYAFSFRDCHFVIINAQIINSGLDCEETQKAWLEKELAENAGKRTFLCTHYPPYLTHRDENENYDNIAEPGRSWLLDLIEKHRPEAVFCGHVHNFWYNRHGETEIYVLPSTAFVRHDYSEFYRGEPGDQNGRNDPPKLGYFVLRIYEKHHVCHAVRTYGATVEPGRTLPPAPERIPSLHMKENPRAPVGVDMRHPWAEVVEITATGALDEFERKKVRNDYPLMALWEAGIKKLRVPLQDLEEPATRERMRLLQSLGHEFTVYTFGVPAGARQKLLSEHHDVISAWELVCNWPELDETLAAVGAIKARAPLTVHLSKLRSKEDLLKDGSRYFHFINHGFVVAERDVVTATLKKHKAGSLIDGFVFRVAREASPWSDIAAAGAIAAELGVHSEVHIRMASSNPAEDFVDDLQHANRFGEAIMAAMAQERVGVFIDTFADIDRGYFVRNGLVDRRYNPRLGSHVFRHLYSALNASEEPLQAGVYHEIPGGRLCTLDRPGTHLVLVLPEETLRLDRVVMGERRCGDSGTATCIDLATGISSRVPWHEEKGALALPGGIACAVPTLISFAPQP